MGNLNFVTKPTKLKSSSNAKWKILIADDDIEVHNITKTVLSNFEFDNIGLEFISVFSGKEAITTLQNSTNIAVILLDVVMETNDAGLQVVKFIREELSNTSMRIVLRTGQPGSAPEQVVIKQYQIDDYKEKTELTTTKLYTTLLTSLRTYKALNSVVKNNIQLYKEQQKLQYSQKLLKNILNTVPARICWKDSNSVFLGCNALFLEDAGLDNEIELIGKTDYDMVWKDLAEVYIEDDKLVMDSDIGKINYTDSMIIKNNKKITASVSKVPLRDESNNIIGILSSYTDISKQVKVQHELKEKETLLSQQSKMAAMGEMLGNIAHQWRQPLSVITTAASGIQIQRDFGTLKDEELVHAMKEIMKSSNYLSQTIDDFRDFFKPNKEKTFVDLEDIIDKTLGLVSSKLKNLDIKIVKSFDKHSLYGLDNELIQAFMIILNNTTEAFENKDFDKVLFINIVKQDNNISISFKDNAGGIPDDIINRVFEPYFTTKHKSQGTGIGLYMTEEIIVKHMKGSIEVKNETFEYNNQEYTGANFIIKLPT